MSLRLPAASNPIRSAFSIEDLAEIVAAPSSAPTFPEAVRVARSALDASPAAISVNVIAVRASGELWLIEVTREGWARRWSFGAVC